MQHSLHTGETDLVFIPSSYVQLYSVLLKGDQFASSVNCSFSILTSFSDLPFGQFTGYINSLGYSGQSAELLI